MQQGVKKDATCNIQQCCVRGVLTSLDVTCCVRLHTKHTLLQDVARCCVVLLGVVAQSLKNVKRLATCKRTQQLSTLLVVAVSVCT